MNEILIMLFFGCKPRGNENTIKNLEFICIIKLPFTLSWGSAYILSINIRWEYITEVSIEWR